MKITSSVDYQLSIEATAGPGFAGDIAIDDINVEPGLCPDEEGCDFEGRLLICVCWEFIVINWSYKLE